MIKFHSMFNHSALSHLVKIICCSVSLSHWSLPLCLSLTYSIVFMRQRWDCWMIMGMSMWRHYHILLLSFPAYSNTLYSTTPTHCFYVLAHQGSEWLHAVKCHLVWFGHAEVRLNTNTVLWGHSASGGHRDRVQVPATLSSLTDGMGLQSIMGFPVCRFHSF